MHKSESPESLAVTRRAEEIREATGIPWEYACLRAERERDAAVMTFDATGLRAGLPLNRVCLHVGPSFLRGATALCDELRTLQVGATFDVHDPFDGRIISITRTS